MPLRYYPQFYIVPNLKAEIGEFLENGKPYEGPYYATLNGRYFSGLNPQVGPNNELIPLKRFDSISVIPGRNSAFQNRPLTYETNESLNQTTRDKGRPTFYYPKPTESDYKRGYIIRYFAKKENERNGVIEISYNEYVDITNGTVDYDISIYQTAKILWKLTGPLKSQRKSQYNIIPGIIDTNKRLTEETNKTFLGIVDFIGGEYDKFARPTA